MKKYRIEVKDTRDNCLVYKHSTNNFETLERWFSKYSKECNKYVFYRYDTYCEIYIDNKLNTNDMLFMK